MTNLDDISNMYNGKKIKDLSLEEKREYNRIAQRKFNKKHPKIKERTDIYKYDINKEDRCENFDELWDIVHRQVLQYWDKIPKYNVKYKYERKK